MGDDRLLAAATPTPIGRALQSDLIIILITLHLLLSAAAHHAASVVILCSVSVRHIKCSNYV